MKKGVGSRVRSGSGSIGQRCGSEHPDPDPQQNVTDPQTHWLEIRIQYNSTLNIMLYLIPYHTVFEQ
jgi:hypothetical protein